MDKWNSKSRSSVSNSNSSLRPNLPTPVRSPEALSALAQARAELNSSSSSSSSSTPSRDESRRGGIDQNLSPLANENDLPKHVGEAMRRLRSAYRERKVGTTAPGETQALSPPNSPRALLAKYTVNNEVTNVANEIKFVRFESEIADLKRLRNEAAAHVDVLQADLQIANNRIDELRGELNKAGVHFEEKKLEFGSSVNALHAKVAEAHAERKRRTELAMVALVFLRAEKKRERKEFEQREASLLEAKASAEHSWKVKIAAVENTLVKEKATAAEALAELQGLYTDKSNTANEFHVRAEAAEGKLIRVETDLTNTRQHLASERETNAQLNDEVASLEKTRATLENDLRINSEKLSELRKDFFALKTSSNATISDLEANKQANKETIDDLMRALGESQVKLSSEKAAVEWAQARTSEFQTEARDLRAEISKYESRASGAAKEAESLRRELKTVEYELQDERARVKALTETLEKSTHTYELECTISELRSEVAILQADRDRQLEKAGGMLLAVHAAEKRIADAKSEAEASASEMLRELQASSSARVREAQVEIMVLKDKINEERTHARNLEKEVQALKQRVLQQQQQQQQQQFQQLPQATSSRTGQQFQQGSGTPGSPATMRNSQRPMISSAAPIARSLPVVATVVATVIEESPREPTITSISSASLPIATLPLPSLPPPPFLPPPLLPPPPALPSSNASVNHTIPAPIATSVPAPISAFK